MESKKVKTYTIEHGGEKIVGDHLGDMLEHFSVETLEPEQGEESVEITIKIERKYTEEELSNLPEYQ